MAAGDLFTVSYLYVATGTRINIQPAVGVNILITHISGSGAGCRMHGVKTGAGSGNYPISSSDGAGGTTLELTSWVNFTTNMKLFINNTDHFGLENTAAGYNYFSYSGIEL